MLTMRAGFVPVREPSWNEPPFYSYNLSQTRCRRIAANTGWTEAQSLEGRAQYVAFVNKFALASDVALDGSGMEFRLLLDGQEPQHFDLPPGEISRETSITNWPVFKRETHLIVPLFQTLSIQVRNQSASDRYYFTGLFGYYYPDVDASAYNSMDRNRRG
jgi:hypothetical protein